MLVAGFIRPRSTSADVLVTSTDSTFTPAPVAQGAAPETPEMPAPTEIVNVPQGEIAPTPLALLAGQIRDNGGGAISASSGGNSPENWNPPALEVPLARHPFDHYWFIRPVAANNRNYGLDYYAFGSNGPANDLRIHHGIDLSNPIGVEVFATGPGTVVWAGEGHINDLENITAYGNTVAILHDFGYNGRKIYTLYAHLSIILARSGQRVESGDVIGLTGNTGLVSGPHVHYEIRLDRNSYFSVYNPELWMAPYAGTGVIAGRVAFENGDPVMDVQITLIDLASGQITHRITSYAGPGVNADPNWNENFVIADVPEGHYLARAEYGSLLWTGEVQVLAGTTNWIDMQQPAASPLTETP